MGIHHTMLLDHQLSERDILMILENLRGLVNRPEVRKLTKY